jgi:hypothetical protein
MGFVSSPSFGLLLVAAVALLSAASVGGLDAEKVQQRRGQMYQQHQQQHQQQQHKINSAQQHQQQHQQHHQQQHSKIPTKRVVRVVRRIIRRAPAAAAKSKPALKAVAAQHRDPVLLERAARSEVEVSTHVMASMQAEHQSSLEAALSALGTIAVSADADAEQELILQDPGVQAALAAKTPDAVDKLIQGILDGTGQGGVVTSEFNQNGVHATIISNVNELRITQIENDAEERNKAAAESDRKNAIVGKANQAASASSQGSAIASASSAGRASPGSKPKPPTKPSSPQPSESADF